MAVGQGTRIPDAGVFFLACACASIPNRLPGPQVVQSVAQAGGGP